MMTLKLVGEGKTRIFEAASFTVTEELFEVGPHYCRKVTAHDLVAGGDHCWWVGFPPYEVEDSRVYTAAFIMNSGGKTIEALSPGLPNGVPASRGVPVSQRREPMPEYPEYGNRAA